MTRRQRCSMPRRPGGLRWRRPLAVLLGLTVLLALDGSGILRVGLGCALLHESGHALMYRLLWHYWPELEISPLGICLRLRGLLMTPAQELLLAAPPGRWPTFWPARRRLPLCGGQGTAAAGIGLPAAICWWAAAACCPCPGWMGGMLRRVCCIFCENKIQSNIYLYNKQRPQRGGENNTVRMVHQNGGIFPEI